MNEPIAVLSPASQSHTYTRDEVAGAILINLSGGGVVASWEIHPALPSGMSMNGGNGTITGTPDDNQTSTTYTIYANNSGGPVRLRSSSPSMNPGTLDLVEFLQPGPRAG